MEMGGDKKKRENKCCTPLRRIGWGVNYRALKVPVSRPNGVVIHQGDLPLPTPKAKTEENLFFIFPQKTHKILLILLLLALAIMQ